MKRTTSCFADFFIHLISSFILPMSRPLLLGLIIILLLIGGLVTLDPLWLELTLPLAVYLMVGFILVPEKTNLVIERVISPERAAPGQSVTITLRITNRGDSLRQVALRDSLPDFAELIDGSVTRLLDLRKGETSNGSTPGSASAASIAMRRSKSSQATRWALSPSGNSSPPVDKCLCCPPCRACGASSSDRASPASMLAASRPARAEQA